MNFLLFLTVYLRALNSAGTPLTPAAIEQGKIEYRNLWKSSWPIE